MDLFDLAYKLENFREYQKELFDENGKKYTGVSLSNNVAEMMLGLINDFERALDSQTDSGNANCAIFGVSKSYCGDDGDENIKADLREIYDACGDEQEFIRLYNEMKLEKDEQDFDNYMEDKVSNL
jgi:hypothetical protein